MVKRLHLVLQVEAENDRSMEDYLDLIIDSLRSDLEVFAETSIEAGSGDGGDGTTGKSLVDELGHFKAHIEVEWSGSPCPIEPDNCWIDDVTGVHVDAVTGRRGVEHGE